MKALNVVFLVVAAVSLLLGVIWRIVGEPFPLSNTPPQSFLEFSGVCLLFSLALSVFSIAKK